MYETHIENEDSQLNIAMRSEETDPTKVGGEMVTVSSKTNRNLTTICDQKQ